MMGGHERHGGTIWRLFWYSDGRLVSRQGAAMCWRHPESHYDETIIVHWMSEYPA